MCVIILICILVFFSVRDSVSDSGVDRGVGSDWRSVGSSRSGVGSGVSVVYNTVTPMPCACLMTVVKSCYLAYFDYVGCGIALLSIPGALTVGIFSYV